MATIDVLLPVRNGVSFLGAAIDSIRKQTFSDWRLMILDHGSSDGSLGLAREYAGVDGRIVVFSQPEATNLATLRNFGLEKCDCRYLLLQDADDISFANRMDLVVRAFEDRGDLLAVGGQAVTINANGRQTGYLQVPCGPEAIAAGSFFHYPMLHPTTAVNYPAMKRLGAAYGKDILQAVPASQTIAVDNLAEDYILFGQLALLGPCVNLPVPFIKYRRHGGSVGVRDPRAQIELALRISRFLARSFCFLKGLEPFDPGPLCNHADYVFDFGGNDYSSQFASMAESLRRGIGTSAEIERELQFRWVLATRKSSEMARRFLQFKFRHEARPNESRTVRNWLLRNVRQGKYVYRPAGAPPNTDLMRRDGKPRDGDCIRSA